MGASQNITPGTVFGGDYVVERTLAAGGMGAVYVVRQRSTQKLRALKTLLPEHVADPSMRERFAREAVAGAHIESDHVVEVLAAGVDEATGVPWLVMEFLQGDDLAGVVKKRGALARSEVIEAARQLGHALTAAHRGGVVHRDLKPENLFLSNARREGVPFTLKVLDFGIARLLHTTSAKATTSAMGSPLWMAPEQTDAALPITPATDVWAVGLIFFWALTGTHYWFTPRQPDGTIGSMIRELLSDPLPTASARAASFGVAERLPPGFDAWFARCVCRDPSGRFRDASACFPPLVALLEGAGAMASPVAAPVASAGVGIAPTQHAAASLIAPTLGGAPYTAGVTAPTSQVFPPSAPMSAVVPTGAQPPLTAAPQQRSKLPLVLVGVLGGVLLAVAAAIALRPNEPQPAPQGPVAAVDPPAASMDAGAVTRVAEADDPSAMPQPGAPVIPGAPGGNPRVLPPGFDAGRMVFPLLDATSPTPVEPPPTAVEPPPVTTDVPLDRGEPVVDRAEPAVDRSEPAPPPDVIAPPPDRSVVVTPPPPDVSQPSTTPEPQPEPEGCERHSNCSTCLADRECGWCQRAGRCLRGNWATGPNNGACSGDDWVGDATHCDDRCARFSNCSTCLANRDCGWCQNANRCVSGNWATGPYHGACGGSSWIGDATHCDDRCARSNTCGACVNERNCGWCNNVRRCVSGNWATGPYNGACSTSDWAGQESACP